MNPGQMAGMPQQGPAGMMPPHMMQQNGMRMNPAMAQASQNGIIQYLLFGLQGRRSQTNGWQRVASDKHRFPYVQKL